MTSSDAAPGTQAERRVRAEQHFVEALRRTGARDPRDFYRDRLRLLRAREEELFQRGVRYYEDQLIPTTAQENSDPLAEWMEYGRFLAELMAPGRTVQIDPTGRAHPYAPPVPIDQLVLHLPNSTRERTLVVGLPPELSLAQRASFDLLVTGKQE